MTASYSCNNRVIIPRQKEFIISHQQQFVLVWYTNVNILEWKCFFIYTDVWNEDLLDSIVVTAN